MVESVYWVHTGEIDNKADLMKSMTNPERWHKYVVWLLTVINEGKNNKQDERISG